MKKIIILVFVTVAIFSVSFCLKNYFKAQKEQNDPITQLTETKNHVAELNEKSHLPFDLLTKFDELDRDQLDSQHQSINHNRSFDYYTGSSLQDAKYALVFAGFPNDESEYCLTKVQIDTPDFHFYGIRVGYDPDHARDILLQNGYQVTSQRHQYQKNDIILTLKLNEQQLIKEMTVAVKTKYNGQQIH